MNEFKCEKCGKSHITRAGAEMCECVSEPIEVDITKLIEQNKRLREINDKLFELARAQREFTLTILKSHRKDLIFGAAIMTSVLVINLIKWFTT